MFSRDVKVNVLAHTATVTPKPEQQEKINKLKRDHKAQDQKELFGLVKETKLVADSTKCATGKQVLGFMNTKSTLRNRGVGSKNGSNSSDFDVKETSDSPAVCCDNTGSNQSDEHELKAERCEGAEHKTDDDQENNGKRKGSFERVKRQNIKAERKARCMEQDNTEKDDSPHIEEVTNDERTDATEEVDNSGTCLDGSDLQEGGALWDIFRREDTPRLEEYLKKHFREFRHIFCCPLPQVLILGIIFLFVWLCEIRSICIIGLIKLVDLLTIDVQFLQIEKVSSFLGRFVCEVKNTL